MEHSRISRMPFLPPFTLILQGNRNFLCFNWRQSLRFHLNMINGRAINQACREEGKVEAGKAPAKEKISTINMCNMYKLADKLSTTFLPRRSLSSAFDILASFISTRYRYCNKTLFLPATLCQAWFHFSVAAMH